MSLDLSECFHTGATPSHFSAASIASLMFFTAFAGSHLCQLGQSPGARASTRAPNVVPSFQSLVKFFTALSGIYKMNCPVSQNDHTRLYRCNDHKCEYMQNSQLFLPEYQIMFKWWVWCLARIRLTRRHSHCSLHKKTEYLRLDPFQQTIFGALGLSVKQIFIVAFPHGQRDRVVQNQCPHEAEDELEFTVDNVRSICQRNMNSGNLITS